MGKGTMSTETLEIEGGLLATIMSEENFWPSQPGNLKESGLAASLVESLILKHLAMTGTCSGRAISEQVCLPFGILDELFGAMRTRQLIVHSGAAPFNDYYYTLTENGNQAAQTSFKSCAYNGPAPVPFSDYVLSVEAQSVTAEMPGHQELESALSEISVTPELFDTLGPAVNSGAGMFLYGAPGNGKSTIARCMTDCFGQSVWIPYSIIEGGQIIKLFDPSYHQKIASENGSLVKANDYDQRWVKVRRPTVIVGGELTMDNLEIRYDARTNTSEAPLQMKSNGGCLLIDDFGRQQIAPAELLNRWIVPLENRLDYLTLGTGKKIQVPFDQLIIFSTNLDPSQLVDEAFLRRIPYKIEIGDPSEKEFFRLFEMAAEQFGCEYRAEVVAYVIDTHYQKSQRPMRRCHPRDLMRQVRNYCTYYDRPIEMDRELFDRVAGSYFTNLPGQDG